MCELPFGGAVIKYILLFFNFLKWLAGAAMISVGLWMIVDNPFKDLQALLDEMNQIYWDVILGVIIAVGCLVFIVGFLGCCGALQENRYMLIAYSVILSVVILMELTIIILVIVFKSDIEQYLQTNMNRQIQNDYINETSNTGITGAWNSLMVDFACCGESDYTDWKGSSYTRNYPDNPVPYTCCISYYDEYNNLVYSNKTLCLSEAANYTNLPDGDTIFKFLNAKGCYPALTSFLKSQEALIVSIMCGIAVILIAGVVFGCCLQSSVANRNEVGVGQVAV